MNFSFSLLFSSLLHRAPLMPCCGLLLGDFVGKVRWRWRRRREKKYWVPDKSICCEVSNDSSTFVCLFIRIIEYLKLEGTHRDHHIVGVLPQVDFPFFLRWEETGLNSLKFIEAIHILYSLAVVTFSKLKTREPAFCLNVLSKKEDKLLMAHSVIDPGKVIHCDQRTDFFAYSKISVSLLSLLSLVDTWNYIVLPH